MFTIGVCDDCIEYVEELCKNLENLCVRDPLADELDVRILPGFGSAVDVLMHLEKEALDALFLDIEMPGINGMQLAAKLKHGASDTKIIFVTAHNGMVFQTLPLKPFAFIRKSYMPEELPSTFHRLLEECQSEAQLIPFHAVESEVTLRAQDILYFVSRKNYYDIHCTHGTVYTCRGTMSDAEKRMQPYHAFCRIHASFLINMKQIRTADRVKRTVEMADGAVLDISYRKLSAFSKQYLQLMQKRGHA